MQAARRVKLPYVLQTFLTMPSMPTAIPNRYLARRMKEEVQQRLADLHVIPQGKPQVMRVIKATGHSDLTLPRSARVRYKAVVEVAVKPPPDYALVICPNCFGVNTVPERTWGGDAGNWESITRRCRGCGEGFLWQG